jgi:NDP-sugar pyrophosphorylase family protein
MAYFGDGSRLGVSLDYSLEEAELSTIGPLTLIDDLPHNFLVMNGDILCNLDYRSFFMNHVNSASQVSVSSYRREVKIDFGVLQVHSHGLLNGFKEKPVFTFDVSMGIYCINRAVIAALPRGVKYGFDNLMLDRLANKQPVHTLPFSGYWLDIGRPDDYEYANNNFDELSKKLGLDLT